MENFNTKFNNYIHFCKTQKCLDLKTIRAYTIDLSQFFDYIDNINIEDIESADIESYISHLHSSYKPNDS